MGLSACSPDDSLSVRLGDLEQVRFDPGYHLNSAHLSSGQDVPFVIWSPGVTSTSRLPLVIVLHGGGQTGPYQGESVLKSLFQPALDMRAIFVAPTAVSGHWATPNGAALIHALVDGIRKADWPVDPSKIVVVGYSAGGTGVWYLRDQYPDLARAGISVAGDAVSGGEDLVDQPIFIVHGSDDEVFPFENIALEVNALKEHGVNAEMVEVPGAGHVGFSVFASAVSTAHPWLIDILNDTE